MPAPLDQADERRFAAVARERAGLVVPPSRRHDLARAVERAQAAVGVADVVSLHARLLAADEDDEAVQVFLSELTVGETHFFRSSRQVNLLRRHILPDVINRRAAVRRLRLWSAGCATGEEPYTLAILLDGLLGQGEWDVRILATDVDRRALRRAAAGIYRPWSFRGVPPELVQAYFRPCRDGLELVERVRRMVTFRSLNLAADDFPSPATGTWQVDVVVCRNVLMYLHECARTDALQRLSSAVAEGGWLLLGHADPTTGVTDRLTPRRLRGTVAYQRLPAVARPPAARAAPAPRPALAPRPAPAAPPPSPSDPLRLLREATEHADSHRLPEALRCLAEVVERDPLHAHAHRISGVVLHALGDLDGALAAFRRSLYADPSLVLGQVGMAAVLGRTGQRERALRALHAAGQLLDGRDPGELVGDGLTVAEVRAMLATERRLLDRPASQASAP